MAIMCFCFVRYKEPDHDDQVLVCKLHGNLPFSPPEMETWLREHLAQSGQETESIICNESLDKIYPS
jgi:hypothetical protein